MLSSLQTKKVILFCKKVRSPKIKWEVHFENGLFGRKNGHLKNDGEVYNNNNNKYKLFFFFFSDVQLSTLLPNAPRARKPTSIYIFIRVNRWSFGRDVDIWTSQIFFDGKCSVWLTENGEVVRDVHFLGPRHLRSPGHLILLYIFWLQCTFLYKAYTGW